MSSSLIYGIDDLGFNRNIGVDEKFNLSITDNTFREQDELLLTSTRGILAYSTSSPAPQEDEDKRDGWYYENVNISDSLIIETFDSNSETKTLGQLTGINMVYTMDIYNGVNSEPTMNLYTKPTGVNDANINYHSKVVYKLLSSADKPVNEKIISYISISGSLSNNYPLVKRYLKHILFEYDQVNSEGEQLDDEELLKVSIETKSTASVGDVKILIETLGLVFNDEEHRYLKLKTQTGEGTVNIGTMPATQATYNTTPPTVVDGNNENLQCDENGNLKTSDINIRISDAQEINTSESMQGIKLYGRKQIATNTYETISLNAVNDGDLVVYNKNNVLVGGYTSATPADLQGVKLFGFVSGNTDNHAIRLDTNYNLKTSDSKIRQLQNQENSTTSPLQSVKILGYNTTAGQTRTLRLDSNDNLNVNVNNSSSIDVSDSNIYSVLSSDNTVPNTEKLQATRLYGYRNDAGIYTDAHYPLTLNNDSLNVNLSNITTTANINSVIKNFDENKTGIHYNNVTVPTLTTGDETKLRVSENAELIVRERCSKSTGLDIIKTNGNLSLRLDNYDDNIDTPVIPYRYDIRNDDFILDVGHPTHMLRDYRKLNQVFSYNVTFNYTNVSNTQSLFFFQNNAANNLFIYSVSLEAHSPTNPANGEYMFVLLNVMTGLNVSGNLPQTNGNSRESSFSFHALPQGEGNNIQTGDTTSSGIDRGQLMTLFIGQGARNYQELNLLDTLLRIRQNEGLRIRVEGNMQRNINYNLTLRYIRSSEDL